MNRIIMTLVACTFLAVPLRADEKPVKVPFDLLDSGHFVVNVKVNGKGPYELVFDTGSPVVLLNTKVAMESGVLDKDAKKPFFSLFGALGETNLKTLAVGEVKAKDVPCLVMDHPTVEAIAQHFKRPIQGIVGFPFFARYTMTVDYQAKEMTFAPNGYKPTNLMQSIQETMTSRMGKKSDNVKILIPAAQWGFSAEKSAADDEAGLTIKHVLKDSPADKAGLKVGDRLLTLDGRWTDTQVDLFEAAVPIKAGRATMLKVKRGEKEIEVKVTPKAGL